MILRILPALLFLISTAGLPVVADPAPSPGLVWQPWGDAAFAQAKREHKFVLLDLQAVWCHWCHVMDEQTYSDPNVMALLQSRYVVVRVDQDSRPDLANRYQDYGWPATIVFDSDGHEIVKRSGFLPPRQMASMLKAIIDDPSPGPSVTGQSPIEWSATSSLLDTTTLKKQLMAGYDRKEGSWGNSQKFLNWDNIRYCLLQAQKGDREAEKMARQTLQAQLNLVDPVWGGVDQYSTDGDWKHPHFEKIMQMQAENLRIYAEAYSLWKDPLYLRTATGIYGYVREFLTSPDGVVYTSQDADLIPGEHSGDYFKLNDTERRKLGIPRIDKHIYSRENGWFIEALTALYAATGEAKYRDEARRAAGWILDHRSTSEGGFRHGEETSVPLTLGDNLAMGRAFLDLYGITGNRSWLDRAERTAEFIRKTFSFQINGTSTGFATAANQPATGIFAPQPDFDENLSLARFANLLFHSTGNPDDRRMAQTAFRFVANPDLDASRLSSVGGLLLAQAELAHDPLHIAIVGNKSDSAAQSLFETAIASPVEYKEIEWIDPQESSSSVESNPYPRLRQAAAYLCVNQACSSPAFDPGQMRTLLMRQLAK